jgi:hypothetical protein
MLDAVPCRGLPVGAENLIASREKRLTRRRIIRETQEAAWTAALQPAR